MRRFRVGAFVALFVTLVGIGWATSPRHGPALRIVVRGQGQVTCTPRCPANPRREGVVRLTAKPAANYEFDHWSGVCIGLVPECQLALDRNTTVKATFVGKPTQVAVSAGGPGNVKSIPPGLDCGGGAYTCELTVPYGSQLTLVPSASSDGRFAGWDGACASAGLGNCTLRINALTETAAAFGHSSPLPGEQPLTVVPHDDQFRVTSQPAGIDCPPTCTASFASGTLVTLRRNLGMWVSVCTGLELDRCAFVLDAPTQVELGPTPPGPDPEPPPTTRIRITVSGPGLISSSDGRLHCGHSLQVHVQCTERVSAGGRTVVRLRGRARAGARLAHWGGACSGTTRVCNLKPQGYQTLQVTAAFRRG